MKQSIYHKIDQVLTWKRIAAFNIVLLLALIIPLSIRLSNEDTELRSNAAGEDVLTSSPTPPPNYPLEQPGIDRVSTFYGKSGDTIIIIGKNFGDYQWGSTLLVGNMQVSPKEIVRWSNTIIEVQIPEGARTGQVSLAVNEQAAVWEGTLVVYDATRASKIGMTASSATVANLWLDKGNSVRSGIIEIAYSGEPTETFASPYITIVSQAGTLDVLGKKVRIEFIINGELPRGLTNILTINHPEIGGLEIVRAELLDASGRIVEVYSDPLSLKL